MQYRTLGRTGLEVSILSYGASPLGSVFRDIDESEGIRTVHIALDLGINYIDVAPYYGGTRAETVLGKALAEIDRERYHLATKVGRYGDQDFDFSAERVTASVDESLRRLGVDVIDVIQCHDIEFGSLEQVIGETLPALGKVREQGKVRFIGITGLPLRIFETVLAEAEVDTILSYCRYSLNDTSLNELLPELERRNLGVISASPLSMGLLTERGAPAWHPADNEIQATARRAVECARAHDVPLAKLALQFAVANPDIHTTLVGTASVENIERNVAWVEEAPDEALIAEVQAVFDPVRNRTWPSGRPENN